MKWTEIPMIDKSVELKILYINYQYYNNIILADLIYYCNNNTFMFIEKENHQLKVLRQSALFKYKNYEYNNS